MIFCTFPLQVMPSPLAPVKTQYWSTVAQSLNLLTPPLVTRRMYSLCILSTPVCTLYLMLSKVLPHVVLDPLHWEVNKNISGTALVGGKQNKCLKTRNWGWEDVNMVDGASTFTR